jgi:hypothetical protein
MVLSHRLLRDHSFLLFCIFRIFGRVRILLQRWKVCFHKEMFKSAYDAEIAKATWKQNGSIPEDEVPAFCQMKTTALVSNFIPCYSHYVFVTLSF